MSTINKSLSGFIFNGSALALASASFKGNLNTVYGFNSAGNAYTSFKPSNTFNSLTQLVQDGVYIVDAKTTGFDIPGALLTASTPAATPTPFSINTLDAHVKPNGYATVSVNVDGADQLRIGSVLLVLNGTEQTIDTDATGVPYVQMADEGGIPLEFLRNGQVLLSYPFYAKS